MTDVNNEMISKIIEYFNHCYQSDNREHRLWDVFSKKNEYLRFLNSAQINKFKKHEDFLVNTIYGNKLYDSIAMYRREKACLLVRYFLVGKLTTSGGLSKRLSRICAPLLMYEASLNDVQAGFTVSVDTALFRWNTPLLTLITEDKDIENKLTACFDSRGNLDLQRVQQTLKSAIDIDREISLVPVESSMTDSDQNIIRSESHQQIDFDYDPEFTASSKSKAFSELSDLRKQADNKQLHLVSASCLLLTKRSLSSRGIVDELNGMAVSNSFTGPITHLFGNGDGSINHNQCVVDNVPGILSNAQKKALVNAAQKDLSVLIGPPGTGKSYTIACVILERFMQGESVLLVTQNESAVDVVMEKLVRQLGVSSSAITRAGKTHHQRQFLGKLNSLLNGMGLKKVLSDNKDALIKVKQEISKAENRFHKDSESAVNEGVFIEALMSGRLVSSLFNRIKKWFIMRRFNQREPLFEQLHGIHQKQISREQLLSEQINNNYQRTLKKLLKGHRKQLITFQAGLTARTSMTQKDRFSKIDFSLLLEAFPIWLCSLKSLHRTLPLKQNLFDLVIIDEATQCDMASCLPALYRAKRALIVGDPKQLRHISFLSADKQLQILKKMELTQVSHELNYRDQSMIDFGSAGVQSQEAVVMLDEHYRSKPEIINFSNQEFYNGHLRIMTEKPLVNKDLCLTIDYLPNGMRSNGVNKAEVDAVISHIQVILQEQLRLPPRNRQTIGVLSFFREQAEAIDRMLFESFSIQTLATYKIRASTPYGFQGEERDIMLISCGLDKNSPAGAIRYLDRPDVFNVSISRAKHQQIVLTSVQSNQLPNSSLLKKYLEYVAALHTKPVPISNERDHYLSAMVETFMSHGIQVVSNYSVAGVAMDLVLIHQGHCLVIDLIGFPGEYEDVHHLDRYKIFDRAELEMFPLSFNAWIHQKATVIKQIKKAFDQIHAVSIKNISIEYQTQLWKKLLPLNPPIAKQIKVVEYSLVKFDLTDELIELNALVGTYIEFILAMSRTFNCTELSHKRYIQLSKELVDASLNGFRMLVAHRKNGKLKTAMRETVLDKNNLVIKKLSETSRHLLQVVKGQEIDTEIDQVLQELNALNQLLTVKG